MSYPTAKKKKKNVLGTQRKKKNKKNNNVLPSQGRVYFREDVVVNFQLQHLRTVLFTQILAQGLEFFCGQLFEEKNLSLISHSNGEPKPILKIIKNAIKALQPLKTSSSKKIR